MAGELVDKGIDEEERDDQPVQPRRRGLLLGGAAVVAVVAAASLAIAQPWSSSDDETSTQTVADEPDDVELVPPTLPNRLMLGDVPDGYSVEWVNDGEQAGFEEFPGALADSTNVLLVAPGATVSDGRWLAARVVLLDRMERVDFDPAMYTNGDGQPVGVGDMKGAYVAEGFDGASQLVVGPLNGTFLVLLSAVGFPRDELVALAAEMQLDEVDGGAAAWPAFGERLGDLEPLASYMQPGSAFGDSSLYSFLGATSLSSTSVSYSSDDGDGIELINEPVTEGLDTLEVARFALLDPVETTVHGLPAVTGSMENAFGGSLVLWVEGGRSIVLFASGDVDLPALAESVVVADDQEWADMTDAAALPDDLDGDDEPTWLIGVGELEDGTTWLVEGAVGDDGRLTLCGNSLSTNSSMSGCSSGDDVDGPAILLAGGVGGDFGSAVAVVGVVPVGAPGAVLRFTAEDGAITEVELAERRPEWPFHAAALAVTQPGTAEVVAADGTVLATDEIAEDDFSSAAG